MGKSKATRRIGNWRRVVYRTRKTWKLNCIVVGKCWRWKHGYGGDHYPIMNVDGTPEHAHRFAFRLFKGRLKKHALHKCDNKWCVRPAHIYDGTRSRNMKDAWSRHPKNTERRLAIGKVFSRTPKTDNFRRLASERMSKRWSNPKWRRKMKRRMREVAAATVDERSTRMTKLWNNPKWRARQIVKMKNAHRG